ncbi:hypothetical protein [Hymenobacter sp. APR13]|uniref:hypothetical protein n=1 Tax=Hymenobacter sp. APR13 TaxID=1356852 RepID=UPI0012E066C7|nr:hypothetical protein [Hymenobacter sp. APR13]
MNVKEQLTEQQQQLVHTLVKRIGLYSVRYQLVWLDGVTGWLTGYEADRSPEASCMLTREEFELLAKAFALANPIDLIEYNFTVTQVNNVVRGWKIDKLLV